MLSRSVLRAAQPLRMHARCFATETGSGASPPGGGGGSNSLLYVIGATAVGGCGFHYLYNKNYGGGRISGSKIGDGNSGSSRGSQSTTSAAKAAFTGGDQGFLSLKLAEVIDVNHNTKRFRFELPEIDQVPGLPITSAVLARFKGPNDEKATLRPYTPINDENEPGHLELLVKKYPNGPMSTHIHDLQPGQTLDIKGPLPKYPWTANKHDHVALVAGGTGITPMFQLARAIFHDSTDTRTQVTLVFGNVGPDDVLLRKELDELENTHPRRFRAFYVLDRPPPEWQGGRGFISKDLLRTVLPEPGSGNVKIFVCGPPGLMKAISGPKVSPKDQGELSGILKELGYDKEQVYKF